MAYTRPLGVLDPSIGVDNVTLQKVGATLSIKASGVDTAQIKNGAVTDPKTDFVSYDFFYDASIDAKTGTVQLRGANALPSGLVVVAAFVKRQTKLDSASSLSQAALTTGESAGDIQAALVVSNAVWATTGTTITGYNIKKEMTGTRHPALVITIEDLTQGKFWLHIDGYTAPVDPGV